MIHLELSDNIFWNCFFSLSLLLALCCLMYFGLFNFNCRNVKTDYYLNNLVWLYKTMLITRISPAHHIIIISITIYYYLRAKGVIQYHIKIQSQATNMHKNMVYILIHSFLIWIFFMYRGLNKGPLDPEADEIPMCHLASLVIWVEWKSFDRSRERW